MPARVAEFARTAAKIITESIAQVCHREFAKKMQRGVMAKKSPAEQRGGAGGARDMHCRVVFGPTEWAMHIWQCKTDYRSSPKWFQ